MEEQGWMEISEEQRLGVYANEIGILAGKPDITLDFVKAVPDTKGASGEPKRLLVARVTIPWPLVEALIEGLKEAHKEVQGASFEFKREETRAKPSEGG